LTSMDQLQTYHEQILHYFVKNERGSLGILNEDEQAAIDRKLKSMFDRNAEIVKVNANSNVIGEKLEGNHQYLDYLVHYQYLIKQGDRFYIEEELSDRQACFENDGLIRDTKRTPNDTAERQSVDSSLLTRENRVNYTYDRREAVRYAEKWWDSYNPKYKKFDVDCTNFVSQCMHEGGAPMTGFGNQSEGWWYRDDQWSYSWAVAHSLRWYLSGSNQGLQAKEVSSAEELELGDIICYDFEGNGRFDHNTIVVSFDANREPLVNAHTYNSRQRYWKYEDSTAYTPDIKYKFFHILDGKE
jgi:hypothetical protein